MTINPPAAEPWLASEAGGEVRKQSPSVQRNRDAIASVLRDVLPRDGLVLEVASGSGEHVVHFASLFPRLTWQPSDPDPHALASIEAWRSHAGFANVLPPLQIDATAPEWPIEGADAVLCINMAHISPWSATRGLIGGARRLLEPGRPLYLYGPFKRANAALVPSNAAFDATLRQRNPDWGLRVVEDVVALARQHGFGRHRIVDMPVNNLSVIFHA